MPSSPQHYTIDVVFRGGIVLTASETIIRRTEQILKSLFTSVDMEEYIVRRDDITVVFHGIDDTHKYVDISLDEEAFTLKMDLMREFYLDNGGNIVTNVIVTYQGVVP